MLKNMNGNRNRIRNRDRIRVRICVFIHCPTLPKCCKGLGLGLGLGLGFCSTPMLYKDREAMSPIECGQGRELGLELASHNM
jgi:hypothetical protein